MLQPKDKERLARLEADIPWIKESLGRLESGLEKLHELYEEHLTHHRNGSSGGQNGGGVTIVIGSKTVATLLTAVVAVAGVVGAYLKRQGII